MTVYLARYDNLGNCQYVAIAESQSALERFLDAGFVEVSKEEYERCEAIVERVGLADLATILNAVGLLTSILSATRQPVSTVPDNTAQLENIITQQQQQMARLTQRYYAGEIDLSQWYEASSRQITRSRLAARATAVGGVQSMTQADVDAARQAARQELRYLSRFRNDLDTGNMSEAKAIARSRMYAGGNRETYERGIQDLIGLPALPAQPGVRTDCHKNCRCQWRIVPLQGVGNWDCFWIRFPGDSCETCKRREEAFSPLRIRNGIIQAFPTVGIYSQQ